MRHAESARARLRSASWPATTIPRGDDGFSLIELLIATTIGFIILTMVMVSLPLFVQTGENGVALGQAVNRADTALTKIEQQVIAGQLIFNPTTEGTNARTTPTATPQIGNGYSLRVLSSATSPTACYQWRVTTQKLQMRSWPTGLTRTVTPWVTLATGIENSGTTQKPFQLDRTGTTVYGGRLLDIDLVLKSSHTRSTTTQVHTSIAANDAEFLTRADSQFCTPVPTNP